MRHIHVHLHSHPGTSSASVDTLDAPPTTPKPPSTAPARPPSTVIKATPAKGAPRAPRASATQVKPAKPAGVIKGQRGVVSPSPATAPKTPTPPGQRNVVGTAAKTLSVVHRPLSATARSVNLANRGIRSFTNRLAQEEDY